MPFIPKKLYLFTGKGGVGKTTLCLEFAQYLKKAGFQPCLYRFDGKWNQSSSHTSASTNGASTNGASASGVTHEVYNLLSCTEKYVARKLHSKMIAKWVVNTAFFQKFIDMVPGFHSLIFMGTLLEDMQSKPENFIALVDGPSSGHALTLLSSLFTYRDIFKSGPLWEDSNQIIERLVSPGFFKINLIGLPSELGIEESQETLTQLQEIHPFDIDIFLNQVLSKTLNADQISIQSDWIKNQVTRESEQLKRIPFKIKSMFPLKISSRQDQNSLGHEDLI